MGPFKIFLGGLNSTGKTILINTLIANNCSADVCRGSEEFFKWLKIENGNYDILESLSDEVKDLELSKMIAFLIKEVASKSNAKIWIFSGHFGRISGASVTPAVGSWVSEFDLIVLLKADSKILVQRVISDFQTGRRRRNKLLGLIDTHSNPEEIFSKLLIQTEMISEQLSKKFKTPLLKLDSTQCSPTKLISQIYNYINGVK